jgi:pyruvate dehydrogenase E1 component alpha subunit
VEAITYRYQGHGIHDKSLNYRSEDEEARWHARDPIKLLTSHILEEKVMTQKAIDKLRDEIVAELEAKVAEAKESPLPDESELLEDVTL